MCYINQIKSCSITIFFALGLFISFSTEVMGGTASLHPLPEGTFQESKSNKIWQVERSKKMKTQVEVEQFLLTLNKGQYSDWRLPNKQELAELFSIFDMKKNGEIKIRLEGKYWLSNDKGQPFVGAWEIGDQCGPSRTFYKGKAGYIRAVRP